MSSARSAVTLVDWRRRVFALYAAVRAAPRPADGHLLWRTGRDDLMRDHPQSPLSTERRSTFVGLPVATYDPELRFVCRIEDGLSSYGGGVFLPLHDASAGVTSYGGGRYLLDTVKGADLGTDTSEAGDASLVVDLNFAYHPSCTYDPAWACPLAPPGNRLSVAVDAGEQLPPGGWT